MPESNGSKDRYGLPISTSSTAAADNLVEGVDLLLEQNFGPEQSFQQAVEADEGFALAFAGLVYVYMAGGKVAEARKAAQQAQSLAAGTTRREQQQIEALALWANGKGPESLAVIQQHIAEFPRDMLMVRVAQRLYIMGCSSVGAGVDNYPGALFALMKGVAPEYGDDWAFQGQYAFAHHENGLLDEALKLAERSLAQRPTNAVAPRLLGWSPFRATRSKRRMISSRRFGSLYQSSSRSSTCGWRVVIPPGVSLMAGRLRWK